MPSFAGFLNLLVGQLVRRGGDEIVVVQPEPCQQFIERLGAVISIDRALVFGVHQGAFG